MIEWSGGASRIPFVAMNIYLVLVLFQRLSFGAGAVTDGLSYRWLSAKGRAPR